MRLRPPSEQALLPRISERRAEVRAHNETAFLEAYRSTIKAEAQVLEAKPLQIFRESEPALDGRFRIRRAAGVRKSSYMRYAASIMRRRQNGGCWRQASEVLQPAQVA